MSLISYCFRVYELIVLLYSGLWCWDSHLWHEALQVDKVAAFVCELSRADRYHNDRTLKVCRLSPSMSMYSKLISSALFCKHHARLLALSMSLLVMSLIVMSCYVAESSLLHHARCLQLPSLCSVEALIHVIKANIATPALLAFSCWTNRLLDSIQVDLQILDLKLVARSVAILAEEAIAEGLVVIWILRDSVGSQMTFITDITIVMSDLGSLQIWIQTLCVESRLFIRHLQYHLPLPSRRLYGFRTSHLQGWGSIGLVVLQEI